MNISGSLHLYSGEDRELFFTFDDDVAQELYATRDFDLDDIETRRVYVSVGDDRWISRRTLSFSKKQSEIKVSLCKSTTKDGLGALTRLYDWFAPLGVSRPTVVQVVGQLAKRSHQGDSVWELAIEEPVSEVSPPGLKRRRKSLSAPQRAFVVRRLVVDRNTAAIGTKAERRALAIAQTRFKPPKYSCHWRHPYLDSEFDQIRQHGIICDIDVWNVESDAPGEFLEIKAQQIGSHKSKPPLFYLSKSEWQSYLTARKLKIPYKIWLLQYRSLEELGDPSSPVRLIEFDRIDRRWLKPDVLLVQPDINAGKVILVGRTKS